MLLVQLLFQSAACPSLPFSSPPPPPSSVLSDPLSGFGRPLFLGKGPFSLWMGCSFRERLGQEELLAAAGGQLSWQRPWLPHLLGWQQERLIPRRLCLPAPSLPAVGWMEASAKNGWDIPSQDALAGLEPSAPRPPGTRHQGWLFSCHPVVLKYIKNC